MKKKLLLALSTIIAISGVLGMTPLEHKEQPVPEILLEEEIAEAEIIEEVKVCEEGCTLEKGHEGDCVLEEVEEIEVILKTTSMERDLKVKFVDKETGKLISGADFRMKLTDGSKKTKEYSDHDQDGIIWVKDINGGKYQVEMLELEGYVTAKTLSAEVKKKIEYKVVEIAEEVKKESEIVVSKEDAAYGGTSKDESTSSGGQLKDTVESVDSSKKEVEEEKKVQKIDEFGQLVYEKQKLDAFGQPMYKVQKVDEFGTKMYAIIISEPEKYHVDTDKNGKCDRCGVAMSTACTHVDKDGDGVCDNEACKKQLSVEHVHSEKDEKGNCVGCGQHLACIDGADADTLCDGCGKELESVQPEPTPEPEQKPEPEPTPEPEQKPEPEPETEQKPEQEQESEPTPEPTQPTSETEEEQENSGIIGLLYRPLFFLRTAPTADKIVYDTTSAPIYDTASAPVYDTTSAPVYEKETTVIYTGWQTIDGKTYYFDKNGKKVTGQQVIDGVAYTFNSDGVRSGTIGIDVSKYQTGINWKKVKNAGIDFVMIRCGYRGYGSGVLVEDPMFASHIKGAKSAGLRVGVYFFSQAINEAEAVEEASMAVALANKYGINMPIAIDSEYAANGAGRADNLSKSKRTTITKAFCNTVRNAGHTPMVYASKSWLGTHLDVSQLSGYKIWVAHYAEKCGYSGTYHIWQNTDKGKVDGIPGYVDMNISSI